MVRIPPPLSYINTFVCMALAVAVAIGLGPCVHGQVYQRVRINSPGVTSHIFRIDS